MSKDERSEMSRVRAWLETVPNETAVAFASRSALRVLPNLAKGLSGQSLVSLLQPFIRSALTSSVVAFQPTSELRAAASSSLAGAHNVLPDVSKNSTAEADASASFSAAVSASLAATRSAILGDDMIDCAASAAFSANRSSQIAGTASRMDEERWGTELDVTSLLHTPLWHDLDIPDELASHWKTMRESMLDTSTSWQFWISWYESQLKGRPQNWELLTQIARLPDRNWNQGAEHLNVSITSISSKYEEDARSAVRAATIRFQNEEHRLGIGGTFQPSDIDEPELPITRTEYEDLLAAIENLRKQAERNDSADREVVEEAAEVVRSAWVKIRDWCAKQGDSFATEFLKESGKLAAQLLFKYGPSLGLVYMAVQRWLQTLPSP